jgi:transposase
VRSSRSFSVNQGCKRTISRSADKQLALRHDIRALSVEAESDSQSGRKGGVSGRDSPSGGCRYGQPYSSDLRERVVEAVNEGATRSEAAERFGVGVSSAVRWHQAWRETGTFEAKRCGGSRSPLEDYAEEIIALVEDQRDRTLDEIVAAMHERRIPGSRTALFRFLERHGITFKKVLHASEQERTDVARARRRWIREQGLLVRHVSIVGLILRYDQQVSKA